MTSFFFGVRNDELIKLMSAIGLVLLVCEVKRTRTVFEFSGLAIMFRDLRFCIVVVELEVWRGSGL